MSERPMITVPEFAALHGVDRKTVFTWIQAKQLPGAYQSPPDTSRAPWLIPANCPPPPNAGKRGRPAHK